jgi:hypothetical protein
MSLFWSRSRAASNTDLQFLQQVSAISWSPVRFTALRPQAEKTMREMTKATHFGSHGIGSLIRCGQEQDDSGSPNVSFHAAAGTLSCISTVDEFNAVGRP